MSLNPSSKFEINWIDFFKTVDLTVFANWFQYFRLLMITPPNIQNPILYPLPFESLPHNDQNLQFYLSKSDATVLKKQQEQNILAKIQRIM